MGLYVISWVKVSVIPFFGTQNCIAFVLFEKKMDFGPFFAENQRLGGQNVSQPSLNWLQCPENK